MLGWVCDIAKRRELVLILIERNLKIRYKSSFLGFFWSLLSPLFLIGIYSLFLGVLKFPIHLPTLVTGIIAWQFLAMCMGDSLYSIVGNANLVTKAAFPRVILPLSMVGANAVNFLFSFIVLSIYLVVVGAAFGGVWWLPGIMLTQAALCLGMSMMVGAANVFFRDTEHVISVIMLAWFFLSPVIYEPEMIMEGFPRWAQVAFSESDERDSDGLPRGIALPPGGGWLAGGDVVWGGMGALRGGCAGVSGGGAALWR